MTFFWKPRLGFLGDILGSGGIYNKGVVKKKQPWDHCDWSYMTEEWDQTVSETLYRTVEDISLILCLCIPNNIKKA